MTTCNTHGCSKPARKRGHCNAHYTRLLRTGEFRPTTTDERFWRKVDKSGGCWLWTGGLTTKGYGHFYVDGRLVAAHRFAYERHVGPVLAGYMLDHTCHVRACVNPEHLRPVTNKQNAEHRVGAQVNSRTGVRGVGWHQGVGKWLARVQHHGKRITVGYFDTLEEAGEAVRLARLQLFTHSDHDHRPTDPDSDSTREDHR